MRKKISSKIAKCLCGGIKIKVKGKLRHVINCHCKQCMKTHGNYAAYTACLEDDVIFINKKTLKWFKSSNIAKRGFCSVCGASMFYKRLKSRNISIAAGMFSNPTKLKTHSNIFIKGKLDYYRLDSRMPKFDKRSK
ncbi:MAG: GFA family protein [Pelagibacteraceae bacterium]|nr:GFA family protein [Pelagibacteraceae bacterium]